MYRSTRDIIVGSLCYYTRALQDGKRNCLERVKLLIPWNLTIQLNPVSNSNPQAPFAPLLGILRHPAQPPVAGFRQASELSSTNRENAFLPPRFELVIHTPAHYTFHVRIRPIHKSFPPFYLHILPTTPSFYFHRIQRSLHWTIPGRATFRRIHNVSNVTLNDLLSL